MSPAELGHTLRGPLLCSVLVTCATSYALVVRQTLAETYLDEVFHVNQSQAYCRGEFDYWDDKITTPPGLYLISYVVFALTGRCDVDAHRYLNSGLVCLIALISNGLAVSIATGGKEYSQREIKSISRVGSHVAINVALFPPLFFFSALYYTDVASTLVALSSIHYSIKWHNTKFAETRFLIIAIVTGLCSLWCRQTNIFWVAIFPAGLAVVRFLKNSGLNSAKPDRSVSFPEVASASWKRLEVYDTPVEYASVEDYAKTLLSLAISSFRTLHQLVWIAAPYAILIGVFGSFVIWNGGVVLGDKSNHIATIHVPQMLYIWPCFLFFSWPLVLHVVYAIGKTFLNLQHVNRSTAIGTLQKYFPRVWTFLLFTTLATAAVHFNTIVHPFTLADNRHYVFYVFRYLLRFRIVKYLVTPIYVLSAWLILRVLGVPPLVTSGRVEDKSEQKQHGIEEQLAKKEFPSDRSTQISFVIVWLATTTLTVITAPLVEPRYYILSWIMWRLHVPASHLGPPLKSVASRIARKDGKDGISSPANERESDQAELIDYHLWGETAWFLAVNLVTVYIFINWGYAWPQEPGKVQRFMW